MPPYPAILLCPSAAPVTGRAGPRVSPVPAPPRLAARRSWCGGRSSSVHGRHAVFNLGGSPRPSSRACAMGSLVQREAVQTNTRLRVTLPAVPATARRPALTAGCGVRRATRCRSPGSGWAALALGAPCRRSPPSGWRRCWARAASGLLHSQRSASPCPRCRCGVASCGAAASGRQCPTGLPGHVRFHSCLAFRHAAARTRTAALLAPTAAPLSPQAARARCSPARSPAAR